MKLKETVKPISYLKSHTAEMIRDVADCGKTYVITQNGEAKAVFQDLGQYEQTQETLILLKMIAQGTKSHREGRIKTLSRSFKDLRKRIREIK